MTSFFEGFFFFVLATPPLIIETGQCYLDARAQPQIDLACAVMAMWSIIGLIVWFIMLAALVLFISLAWRAFHWWREPPRSAV